MGIKLSEKLIKRELKETRLDLDEEYLRVLDDDPNFIDVISEAQLAMASKVSTFTNSSGKSFDYIPHGFASKILMEGMLTVRHLIEAQLKEDST